MSDWCISPRTCLPPQTSRCTLEPTGVMLVPSCGNLDKNDRYELRQWHVSQSYVGLPSELAIYRHYLFDFVMKKKRRQRSLYLLFNVHVWGQMNWNYSYTHALHWHVTYSATKHLAVSKVYKDSHQQHWKQRIRRPASIYRLEGYNNIHSNRVFWTPDKHNLSFSPWHCAWA